MKMGFTSSLRRPLLSHALNVSTLLVALGLWFSLWVPNVAVLAKSTNTMESLLQTYGNMCIVPEPKTISRTLTAATATSSPKSSRRLTRKHMATLEWLISVTGKGSLLLSTSPQHQAACWMFHDDPRHLQKPQLQFQQRYALATFWFATTHGNSTDQQWDVSDRWMTKAHECDWYGITCSYNIWGQRIVTALEISFNHVGGLLPRELAILKHLQEVDLHGNDLQGVIPHRVLQALTRLKVLRLHMNGFFGSLHTEFGHLTRLQELHLFGNYFAGTIPTELAKLRHLRVIDLYANFIQGTIPSELGRLPHLRELDLHDNNLVGRMPSSLTTMVQKGKLQSLVCDCLNDNSNKATVPVSGSMSQQQRHPKTPQQLRSAAEVQCDGCTMCCQGLPRPKCVDMKTGLEVKRLDV